MAKKTMQLPTSIPCICTNRACGYRFLAPNPIAGGGRNIVFQGNATHCPRCGQIAGYADWHTDSEGKFYLDEVFDYIRNIRDSAKVTRMKAELSAANDDISADQLAKILSLLDPNLEKFADSIRSIPSSAIALFINTVVAILALVLAYLAYQQSDAQHRENKAIQDAQLEQTRNQIKYQKERDKRQDRKEEKTEGDIREIQQKMMELQRKFEEKLGKLEKSRGAKYPEAQGKELKGSLRNKPCPCGSGKKAKFCHPNGYGG